MRRLALAIAPATALLVAGCLGASSTTAVHVHPTRGIIVTVGGPPPGLPAPIPGATFKLVSGHRTVLVGADDHGRFSFVAAPGRYKVVMTGHAPMADGRFIQPQPSAITVGGKRKLIRLVISIS